MLRLTSWLSWILADGAGQGQEHRVLKHIDSQHTDVGCYVDIPDPV